MLAGVPPVVRGWPKPAHAWLKVFGFLSLVIAATFAPSGADGHGSRIVPRRSAVVALAGLAIGAPLVALGFALGDDQVARIGAWPSCSAPSRSWPTGSPSGAIAGSGRPIPGSHRMISWSLVAAPAWFRGGHIGLRPHPLARRRPGGMVARRRIAAPLGHPGPHRCVEPSAPVDRPRATWLLTPSSGAGWGRAAIGRVIALNLGVALVTLGGSLAWTSAVVIRLSVCGSVILMSLAIFVRCCADQAGRGGDTPAGAGCLEQLMVVGEAEHQTRRLRDPGHPWRVPGSRRRAAERAARGREGVPAQCLRASDGRPGPRRVGRGNIGRSGGYRLQKPSDEISLLEVVEAVEGDSRRRVCILRRGPCALDGVCDVHGLCRGPGRRARPTPRDDGWSYPLRVRTVFATRR